MSHLLALLPEELLAEAHADGVRADLRAARRALAHLRAPDGPGTPFPERDPLGKAFAAWLAGRPRARAEVEERIVDPEDGSVRYLFRAPDGARFEAVRIGLEAAGRATVCLSSQAGCAMACDFCATGRLGLGRDLEAHEIVGQFLTVRDELAAEGGRVTGAVFMGQGEPLHNYDAVIRAARVLAHPTGAQIKQEAITISTVGLPDRIRRYSREGHRYRLIVSLTSTAPALRRRLLPVAGKVPLEDLVDALRDHAAALKARSRDGSVGKRLTLAWVLMGGVNHGPDEVEGLVRAFGDLPIQLHVIDVNDARPDGYRRADDAERGAFVEALHRHGIPVVRRYSVGRSRHSACGMLAAKRLTELATEAGPA